MGARKVLLRIALLIGITAGISIGQETSVAPTKHQRGQRIVPKAGAALKVDVGTTEQFSQALRTVKGTPLVVSADFTFAGGGDIVALEPSHDAEKSYVVLQAASGNFAPIAITDSLPAPGSGRKQPISVGSLRPMPRTGRGFILSPFVDKIAFYFLFDLPPDTAGQAKTLFLRYELMSTKQEFAHIVNLGK